MYAGASGKGLNVVGGRRNASPTTGPIGVKELPARLIDAFVRVRAEKVPLRLKQIGGQTQSTISIKKSQCS
jgi:hypothetical protein